MSDEKRKIDCQLKATGTSKANAKVVKDLSIPDPDPAVGKQILGELTEEESKDDEGSKNSK